MPPTPTEPQAVALHEATRQRYLSYALSVITARALPDVRDGLKPVQRRILYAMDANLKLRPDARYRKSAAVVGEVMAKYHPHGDQSIYEALVRMAQPFSLRHTLVDGQGNFGSMDGDAAAAMRYTECRLTRVAMELLTEIDQGTVDLRPTYDGQHEEPEVLPAQLPQLLINGAEGIAVGMATRIPPHNLREVLAACVALIDQPSIDTAGLCRFIPGPDFPTGAVILDGPDVLRQIYEDGSGSVRVRARWAREQRGRRALVVISEIPYSLNKASVVERIGELVAARKLPQVVDVRDESTDQVRVVLELRDESDAEAAMAYLFRHTPLQTPWHVNLTCLVPVPGAPHPVPMRVDLRTALQAWLDFRQLTVRRRFQHELDRLRERIHILRAFAAIFRDLDLAIRLIREAEGRRDAQERLMDAFDLDDVQSDRVLELQLYRLSRLPIADILDELEQKLIREAEIEAILASEAEIRAVIRKELLDLKKLYGEPRRTSFEAGAELEYRESAYILQETSYVVLTRDGWLRRQATPPRADKVRVREGDEVGWVLQGSTRDTLTLFTHLGVAYATRVDDVPATTGYGEPVQKHFKLADGERVVGAVILEPQATVTAEEGADDDEDWPQGVAVTAGGRGLRFPLGGHSQPSQRGGRRYLRLDDGDPGVIHVAIAQTGDEQACIATRAGVGLAFPAAELTATKGAAKGSTAIALKEGDAVLAFDLSAAEDDGPTVVSAKGQAVVIRPDRCHGKRGARGKELLKKDPFALWTRRPTLQTDPPGADAPAVAAHPDGGED
jgi:DNA gyrase subunit A